MELACCLEQFSLSPAFGSMFCHRQAYKIPNSTASHLPFSSRYSAPPSAFLASRNCKFSYPSSSSQHSSLASFVKHCLCALDMGSLDHVSLNVVVALSGSSCSLAAAAERVYAPFIHSSISKKFSSVGYKYTSARSGTCNFSCSLSGTIFSDGEWKSLANFERRNASPPCRQAMMVMTIPAFHVQPKYTCQTCRMTCLARAFGVGNRLTAEQGPQPYCVFSMRRFGKERACGGLFQLCGAIGQNGTGQPVPEEERPEPTSEQGPPDSPIVSPADSDPPEVDWRAFRARLVVTEHTMASDETGTYTDEELTDSSMPLGMRWAHPILAPEAGCVLLATDKIDGQQGFERSVILLLSPGSSNPREGPYGLILNRPLSCQIKDIRPKDHTLVRYFGNCQVHHGGPLDEDMFVLLHGTPGVKGYREVVPGVYYGAASGLEEIIKENRLLDYRIFFGYSGWGVEQLKKEIDAGLWCVAACSTDLITGHSAAGLWEEILLLMGGKYSELSRRPRRRHS